MTTCHDSQIHHHHMNCMYKTSKNTLCRPRTDPQSANSAFPIQPKNWSDQNWSDPPLPDRSATLPILHPLQTAKWSWGFPQIPYGAFLIRLSWMDLQLLRSRGSPWRWIGAILNEKPAPIDAINGLTYAPVGLPGAAVTAKNAPIPFYSGKKINK